jgi:UTP--glucose-1-phosphate uridylyltransferase
VPATRALIEIYEATGQGAITVQEVPREELQFYGVISSSPGKIPRWGDSVLRLNGMVEKPKPDDAPSNLGVSGRYVLPPEIFDYLDQTEPGAAGEIQLTDGLRALAANEGLWAHVHQGKTHDAGNKLGFLKATVELALKNPQFGNKFRQYLKTLEL